MFSVIKQIKKERSVLKIMHYTKTVTFPDDNTKLEVRRNRGMWSKVIDYESSYLKYSESFYFKERLHRSGGPACLLNYTNGNKKAIVWYNKGTICNRRGESAIVKFHENGQVNTYFN